MACFLLVAWLLVARLYFCVVKIVSEDGARGGGRGKSHSTLLLSHSTPPGHCSLHHPGSVSWRFVDMFCCRGAKIIFRIDHFLNITIKMFLYHFEVFVSSDIWCFVLHGHFDTNFRTLWPLWWILSFVQIQSWTVLSSMRNNFVLIFVCFSDEFAGSIIFLVFGHVLQVWSKTSCLGFCRCFSCSFFLAGPFLCTLLVSLYARWESRGGAVVPLSGWLYVSFGWQIVVRGGIRLWDVWLCKLDAGDCWIFLFCSHRRLCFSSFLCVLLLIGLSCPELSCGWCCDRRLDTG